MANITVPISVALIILVFGLRMISRTRFDLQKTSLIMSVCISFAISALTFPYFAGKTQNLLFAVLASLRYGTQALGMNVNSEIVSAMEFSGGMMRVYTVFLYILYILGPVFTSMFLLGFSRTVMELIRFGRFGTVHVFSELNERTAVIAETLQKQEPHGLRVFCAADNASEALKTRARTSHAILVKYEETGLHLRKGREYRFYELFDNPDTTLVRTAKLIDFLKHRSKKLNTSIRTFIHHSQLEVIKDIDAGLTDSGTQVRIRYIDENSAEATELFHNVIPRLPIGERGYHYNILIIGCGDCGVSVLKKAAWLLVLPESSYTIHVVDKNAASIAASLKAECPEFLNAPLEAYFQNKADGKNYDLIFHSADVRSAAFTDLICEIGQPDLTVICMNEDILNFETAKTVRRCLAAKDIIIDPSLTALRMRSQKLSSLVKQESLFLYFGNIEAHYDYRNLIHPELEEAAKVVHRSYYGSSEWTPEIEQAFYRYVNYDSSFAQALAMLARRRWILTQKPAESDPEDWICSYLADRENLAYLGDAEHDRWNAYQRVSGWRCATLEQADAFAKASNGRRVKDDSLLLHPAIVPGKDLAEREHDVDAIRRKYDPDARGVNYVESDRQIISCLPEILKSEPINGQKV